MPPPPGLPPPSPPPPPDPLALQNALETALTGNATTGVSVAISLQSDSTQVFTGLTFGADITASEIVLAGEAGTTLSAAGLGGTGGKGKGDGTSNSTGNATSSRRSLQLDGCNGGVCSLLFTVQAGAPPIILRDLIIRGAIQIEGGSLQATNCMFDGTGLGPTSAITITGGSATLTSSTIRQYELGGIDMTGGTLNVQESSIDNNGAGGSSIFGGLAIRGDGANVELSNVQIEDNGRAANECSADCIRGGGLLLAGSNANVRLLDRTVIQRNRAFEGDQIYVDTAIATTDMLEYHLPTPLGHYVIITDRGTSTQLGMAIVDATFPFECTPGSYGDNETAQSSPRCSGRCPAGYHCPGATVHPILCARGKYCPEGAQVETDCPAGTFSANEGVGSIAGCLPCRPGTQCPAGSAQETECTVGTHAPNSSSATCTDCLPGTYQDIAGNTTCKPCPTGRYCLAKSAFPELCPAGTYSDTTGGNTIGSCKQCVLGRYCNEGAKEPLECPAGTTGAQMGLSSIDQCAPCVYPTYSSRGSTVCDSCQAEFYLDPFAGTNSSANDRCRSASSAENARRT